MSWNYDIQFDLNYQAQKNENDLNVDKYNSDCWENNKLLSIADTLSIENFEELKQSIKSNFNGDYNENISETGKWLLSCFQSLILSIFLWQPLTVYIITWIKIWMFSWNLRMKLAPKNIKELCKKACSKQNSANLKKEIYQPAQKHTSKTQESYYIIAHQDRPLDIIGYFSNDELFLKINEETGKLYKIESDSDIVTNDDQLQDEQLLSTENNKPNKSKETDYAIEGGGEPKEMEMINLKSRTSCIGRSRETKR